MHFEAFLVALEHRVSQTRRASQRLASEFESKMKQFRESRQVGLQTALATAPFVVCRKGEMRETCTSRASFCPIRWS